jgi:YidC/Oxa1 family membrane protein insertase
VKSFDFFSLDYFYYPVSGIMWVWHKVFGTVLGYNSPWAWVLSVVFLVFTLRSLLFKPFMGQMNSQMKMQAVAPELKKLREKHKDDKARLAEEMQKFNKEAGVNPLGGCLPALVQAPVFISLYHVLRSFKPGQHENYFFGASDVTSFVDAKLFGGAPLSAYMTQPWVSTAKQVGLGPGGLDGIRSTVIAVGIPLTVLAAIATHLTSRRSVARQKQLQAGTDAAPQAAIMNKLMLYVFPLGVLAFGAFFPLAIAVYYLSNNSWTFGQLYFAHRIQDKKMLAESKVVEEAKEAAKFSKPAPGARPLTKPGVGAKPVVGAKPTVGSRPAAGAKRNVIQPSSKPGNRSGNGPDDGSSRIRSGSTSPSLSKKGVAANGGASSNDEISANADESSNGSLSTNGVVSNGLGSPETSAGSSAKPKARPAQTNAKKKKPGQR